VMARPAASISVDSPEESYVDRIEIVQEELTQSRMSHRQDREDSKKLEDFMT
nr:hypothetical protein [Tanacetum cinerariifolium]